MALAAGICPASAGPGGILAQLAERNFERRTLKQGLPDNTIYDVTQDATGFVWVASFNGLGRFDGAHFLNFTHSDADPGSLPDNQVRVVLPGEKGDVWIGTGGHGVIRFDAANGRFEALPGLPPQLQRTRVYALAGDRQGGLWIGHSDGLVHFDPKSGAYQIYGQDGPEKFPERQVFRILVDSKDNLWVGGDHGLAVRRAGSSVFEAIPGTGEIGRQTAVWAVFEDSKGRLWAGTDGDGLARLDPAHGRLVGVNGLSGRDSPVGRSTVRDILEPETGEIWVTTYGSGLFIIDPTTGLARQWRKDVTSPVSIGSDFQRNAWLDRSGLVWIATDAGISTTNTKARNIASIFPRALHPGGIYGSEVSSTLGARDGRVWLGFVGGEVEVIDQNGAIHEIDAMTGSAEAVGRRQILTLAESEDGTVLAGSYGLSAIDPKGLTRRSIGPADIQREVVNAVLPDRGKIWMGSYSGLTRLDLSDGSIKRFRREPGGLSDNIIQFLLKSKSGAIWIATRNGLDLLDPEKETIRIFHADPADPQSLSGDDTFVLAEDQQGRLWIGTGGNAVNMLDHWTAEGRPVFRRFGRREGLLSDSSTLMTVGLDGKIWIKGSETLSSIDPASFEIQNYSKGDGVPYAGRARTEHASTLTDGAMIFPTEDALMLVQPKGLLPWTYRAPLVLSDTRGGDAHAGLPERIRLIDQPRDLSVEFALLDFSAPDLTRYSYQLEGYDPNWIEAGPERRIAAYTNLAPGSYRLRVRAVSRSGFGPSASLEIPVIAVPAWYETIWFHAVELLGVVALIFLGVRTYTGLLHRRQRELQEMIAERTAELIEARDRAEIASRAKSDFLASMSHELRTQLNAIGNYSELLLDDAVASGNDEQAEDLRKIRAANSHLLSLINDILDLAKIEAGKLVLVPERVDLKSFLDQVSTVAEPLRIKRSNRFEFDIEPVMGEIVTDPLRLRQVLLNLLSNAFKFTEGGVVTLSARRDDKAAIFEVRDTGIGMTPEQIARIFNPFEQAERDTARQYGGTGLGLALTHQFVGLLGGTIDVTSRRGAGSVFIVRLPVTMPAEPALAES